MLASTSLDQQFRLFLQSEIKQQKIQQRYSSSSTDNVYHMLFDMLYAKTDLRSVIEGVFNDFPMSIDQVFWLFGFVNDLKDHHLTAAVYESVINRKNESVTRNLSIINYFDCGWVGAVLYWCPDNLKKDLFYMIKKTSFDCDVEAFTEYSKRSFRRTGEGDDIYAYPAADKMTPSVITEIDENRRKSFNAFIYHLLNSSDNFYTSYFSNYFDKKEVLQLVDYYKEHCSKQEQLFQYSHRELERFSHLCQEAKEFYNQELERFMINLEPNEMVKDYVFKNNIVNLTDENKKKIAKIVFDKMKKNLGMLASICNELASLFGKDFFINALSIKEKRAIVRRAYRDSVGDPDLFNTYAERLEVLTGKDPFQRMQLML